MKLQNIIMTVLLAFFISCGGGEKKETKTTKKPAKKAAAKKATPKKDTKSKTIKATEIVDLVNKGIGPVKSVKLDATINQDMVAKGKVLFKNKCSACHRTNKRFIGPNPTGVLKIRTPEWVMNMILNPGEMIQKDPLAKKLLIEFNGSPMANQNLTREEARQVLEFFRTLK